MKHRAILVMGVAGSGKTTIGQALGDALDAAFLDADDYHPPENIALMAAGKPLNDAMRWPWLDALGAAVRESARNQQTVFACSALKRVYRDYLRACVEFTLIYPDAPIDLTLGRMSSRKNHFMPIRLLRDQYKTLNPPTKDEDPIIVDVARPVSDIIADLQLQLS